ncbi:glycoside hydrolase family 16 protein [Sphingomonas koreensis]|nr:glycoside hydrolase family 16 protein [Sphingomonas koreensis]
MTSLAGLITLAIAATLSALGSQPSDKPVEGPPTGLKLVSSFDEEFDGGAIDSRRWSFALNDPQSGEAGITKRTLWGNGELQVYSDPGFLQLGIDPFHVGGGTLTVSARPLDAGQREAMLAAIGREPPRIRNSALKNVGYSSGLISSRASFAQQYGYFEMRARWSAGKGLWPAFWLLPADGGWPPEIDIVEAHGDKPRTAFQSVHSSQAPSVTRKVPIAGTGQEFHTYGALWTPQAIDYFIDGTKTATIPTPPDMNRPMYIVANLAVGGHWPGNPDAGTSFPASIEIDYIRAWSFADPAGTLPPSQSRKPR